MEFKCSKCGSERMVPLAHVLDQGQNSDGNLKTVVFTNPDAWVFKGRVYAKLKANICGECGFTEFFAEDPAVLYNAYLETRR